MNAVESQLFNKVFLSFLKEYFLHKKSDVLSEGEILNDMPDFYKHKELIQAGIQFLYRSNVLEHHEGRYKISQKAIGDIKYENDKEVYYFNKLTVDLHNAEKLKKHYPFTRFAAIFAFIASILLLLLELAQALNILPYHK